ncbi:hypothetical protein PIB30_027863 [Stylosanthes scabra]|uniref:Uncharacterized protein n=1 Tax=Stylosanthes scabra TaxID=79078 RepID=A0ABU6V9R5_9FABA|nr:hypothetical protein [Stylosanthes scabra]
MPHPPKLHNIKRSDSSSDYNLSLKPSLSIYSLTLSRHCSCSMHMEKSKEEDQKQFSKGRSSSWPANKSLWDCGSTLYDSYELHSFKRQINSAIVTSPRTLSMPHLTDRRCCRFDQPPPPPPPSSSSNNNKSFKISRTFQKLIRFVFKSSSSSNNNNNKFRMICGRSDGHHQNKLVMGDLEEKYWKERLYVVYDEAVLSTIPELPEFETMGGLSPEISSLVRKSASERFTTPTPIRISCA